MTQDFMDELEQLESKAQAWGQPIIFPAGLIHGCIVCALFNRLSSDLYTRSLSDHH